MAGRPEKQTVDYFPHDAIGGKTLFILQNRFGNNGYAVWYKTLALLCRTPGHYYDCNKPADWQYLLAEMALSGGEITEIMNSLAELEAIDPELWHNKVIWCQNLVNRLAPVYKERKASLPIKPTINTISPTDNSINPANNTQSKVKESKVNNTKVLGEFKNVSLTDEEIKKLNERFGETNAEKRIERLSTYLATKNKKYKSHYAVIISWAQKDIQEAGNNGQNRQNTQGKRSSELIPRDRYTRPEDA